MDDKNFKIVKFLVLAMGATLIIGVFFTILMIYQREGGIATSKKDSKQTCQQEVAKLSLKGVIQDVTVNKNRAAITILQKNNKKQVKVYDFCQDKIIAEINQE